MHPPGEISGYRPILQPFLKPPAAILEDVLLPPVPCVPFFHIAFNAILELSQREVEVRRLTNDRRIPRDGASRFLQLHRVEICSARLALVAPRIRVAAHRAGAPDIAVGEEHPGFLVEELFLLFLLEDPPLAESQEEIPCCIVVERERCPRVIVEAHAEPGERRSIHFMVPVHDGLGRDFFLLRRNRDGNPVFIGAAKKQNIPSFQPLVAGVDIRGKIGPRQMAQMDRSVGIGKSCGNKNALGGRHTVFRDTGTGVACAAAPGTMAPRKRTTSRKNTNRI